MAKGDSDDRRIHVVLPPKQWDGTFPVQIKTRADLDRYYAKSNRRKLEEMTRHHRRDTDIHLTRKLEGISECDES